MEMGFHKRMTGKESVLNTTERRKTSKPIMEKRRRERINNSLNELKNLLLESRKKDSSCCSKLEKADILEMTVQHLKTIRSQQKNSSSSCSDPVALAHYRAGFNQSAAEISRYLVNAQDIEVQVRTRLLTYLSNNLHAVLSGQPSFSHAQYTTSRQVVNSPNHKSPLPILSEPSAFPRFTTSPVQLLPATLVVPGTNISATSSSCPVSRKLSSNTVQDASHVVAEERCTVGVKNTPVSPSYHPVTTSSQSLADPSSVWRPW